MESEGSGLDTKELPIGESVVSVTSVAPPSDSIYRGQTVTLKPVDPAEDVDELYEGSHGNDQNAQVWTYMAYGPFASAGAMREWLEKCASSTDPLFLTVHSNEQSTRVGMVSFLSVVPDMRRLELGHIWYSPVVQRSKVNTEAIYLMLCEAFDKLNYRRVEWKCDALNERSRAAAMRLGFSFEGIFNQHMIVKGRNRDTAWYAMLDSDWPEVKSNMQKWLRSEDNRVSLRKLNDKIVRPGANDV
ncbi:MAG: GNAT family N-acetyltransferase [Gammaproteobacteria bacterium]|nr:GNAT family N-acetyltransferase [Gammaproteobacteria bacterium]